MFGMGIAEECAVPVPDVAGLSPDQRRPPGCSPDHDSAGKPHVPAAAQMKSLITLKAKHRNIN